MTDRDPRTISRGTSGNGSGEGALPAVVVDVEASLVEELHHRLAAMVARDVGVQVLPDALDAIVVGAVRRQEVEHDSLAESGQDLDGALGGMDAIVVHDEMDAASTPVPTSEQPEQLTEE